MKKLHYIFAVAAFSILASCGGDHSHENSTSQSDVQVKAIEIHEASSARAKEFRSNLASMFSETAPTDSIYQQLVGLDLKLQEWSKTLVKLPGMECNHAPGEHHHHDHAAEAALEKLSWEELLKLQEAISAELDALFAELELLSSSNDTNSTIAVE